MASNPEANFVRGVNKFIPSEIYSEGMANPYRGGTPDRYYEGKSNVLWVEYKYRRDIPKVWRLHSALSKLQLRWLRRAKVNGVNVCVIAGFGKHGLWISDIERNEYERNYIETNLSTREELAAFITLQCG